MQQIPSSEQIRSLQRRRQQLELRLRRWQTAAAQSNAPNPSLGRLLDDASSSLAGIRGELARLEQQDERREAVTTGS